MTVIKGEGRKISKIDNQVIKIAFPFTGAHYNIDTLANCRKAEHDEL